MGRQIHILPYHNFGQGKYEGLNRDYPMGDTEKHFNEQMKAFQEMIRKKYVITLPDWWLTERNSGILCCGIPGFLCNRKLCFHYIKNAPRGSHCGG